MTNLDLAVFLVAGILGAFSAYDAKWHWGAPLAWFIVAIWALLKLLKVVA